MHRRNLPAPIALSLLTLLAPAACIEEGELDDEDSTADDTDADADADEVEFRSAALENSGFAGGTYLNTGGLTLTKLLMLTNVNAGGTYHGNRLRSVDFADPAKAWNGVVSLYDPGDPRGIQSSGKLAFMTTAGETLTGASLNNTRLHFDTNGDTTPDLEVRLDSTIYDGGGGIKGGPLYYYSVSTRPEGSGAAFKPLCKGDQSWAIFVDGDWTTDRIDRQSLRGDTTNGSDSITLSCMDGALHKCVIQGKRPTDAASEQRHEACVRAITAAYDEQARTVTGMIIDLHEAAGPSDRFTMAAEDLPLNGDFLKEAEWGVEGANCVNRQALRRPGRIAGCPLDPDARTTANCVILNPNTATNIPECDPAKDYSTTFQYGSTLLATYSSKIASTTNYDNVKDVYWGVETGSGGTRLFKGILKPGFEAIINSGQIRKLVLNGGGTYDLVPVEVDGLVYSETYGLMAFEIDAVNKKSRLVKVRPNGNIQTVGPWFDGRVRGADINREETWIVAILRDHPDASAPHSKRMLVAPGTGATGPVQNLTLYNAGTGQWDLFNVSNGSDVARRAWGEGISSEWFISNSNQLFSFNVNTGKVNPVLRTYAADRWFAGLTFQHPTAANNTVLADDQMLAQDIEGADELRYVEIDASSDYSLSTLVATPVPEYEGSNGDLASWVSSVWNPRQGVHRAYSAPYGHRYPLTQAEANANTFNLEAANYFYTYVTHQSFSVPFFECQLPGTRFLLTTHSNCENVPGAIKRPIGEVATAARADTIRLYRLYSGGFHFFTTSAYERDVAVGNGWQAVPAGDVFVWQDPT